MLAIIKTCGQSTMKEIRRKVVIGTNGILLDNPMVKRLMDSGVPGVGISLDSIDPFIHDTLGKGLIT